MPEPVPVTILTGYLGSGKTTLLRKLLEAEGGGRTAVLVNEFGEVGIDHLIVRSVSPEAVVLRNGCVCCTVRMDLQAGLRDLIDMEVRSGVRSFERIIVETTGLADPVPIVRTLVADPMLRHQVQLASLVSTVDGLLGLTQLDTQNEAIRQAASADRLVLTKTDISDPETIGQLCALLAVINPTAAVINPASCDNLWRAVLGQATAGRQGTVPSGWLDKLESASAANWHSGNLPSRHEHTIRTFAFRTYEPVDWTSFSVWLSAMVHRHGRKLLRVKGLLAMPGVDTPILLNAVQSFVHPPVHLDRWPNGERSSRLVFITQALEPETVSRSLKDFLGLPHGLSGETRTTPSALHIGTSRTGN